jgi:hypothetical protein
MTEIKSLKFQGCRMLLYVFIFLVFNEISAATFKPEKYAEVALANIKATPEEYKNKRIFIVTSYRAYRTTFPAYVERSGFKPGKYYYLRVVPESLPVMAKKDDELNEIIPTLGKGRSVKIYGKIKKFSATPHQKVLPRYYLELEKLEVLEVGKGAVNEKVDDDSEEAELLNKLKKLRRKRRAEN